MILNLTQHPATTEQDAAGVVEPPDKGAVQALLTFADAPTAAEILARAQALAQIAADGGHEAAMIGGAGYLMGRLEIVLWARGVRPCHSFSRRVSAEQKLPGGAVTKTAVFRHVGFVQSWTTTA